VGSGKGQAPPQHRIFIKKIKKLKSHKNAQYRAH